MQRTITFSTAPDAGMVVYTSQIIVQHSAEPLGLMAMLCVLGETK